VTGSLDPGESPKEAAHRELAEETGLGAEGSLIDRDRSRTFSIDPRWRDRYAPGITENTEHEWHYRLASAIDIKVDDNEHSDFRWAPIDQAIDTVWSWTNKEALTVLKAKLLRD
jgi:dATP pyrophosphohydrolase